MMNTATSTWAEDLAGSRDLGPAEKKAFHFLLSWFDWWRGTKGLGSDRGATVRFWREQVTIKPRKPWQVERWAEALRWHAHWQALCRQEGREIQGVGERIHRAVMQAGARRGLARRTRETYAGWGRRFGLWVGDARQAMNVEAASRWLMHLVDVDRVSYGTQKQALNARVAARRSKV